MKTVSKIEKLLAEYSFDCDFTRNTNLIAADLKRESSLQIVDSQNNTRRYTPGYQPFSKECFHKREDCHIKCNQSIKTDNIQNKVDMSTYRPASSEETIREYMDAISILYGTKEQTIMSMTDLLDQLQNIQR